MRCLSLRSEPWWWGITISWRSGSGKTDWRCSKARWPLWNWSWTRRYYRPWRQRMVYYSRSVIENELRIVPLQSVIGSTLEYSGFIIWVYISAHHHCAVAEVRIYIRCGLIAVGCYHDTYSSRHVTA